MAILVMVWWKTHMECLEMGLYQYGSFESKYKITFNQLKPSAFEKNLLYRFLTKSYGFRTFQYTTLLAECSWTSCLNWTRHWFMKMAKFCGFLKSPTRQLAKWMRPSGWMDKLWYDHPLIKPTCSFFLKYILNKEKSVKGLQSENWELDGAWRTA